MTFGEKFKHYRKQAGLTQEEVAEILVVTPQAVSKWECDNGTPDLSLLVPIADLFSISTDNLLGRCDAIEEDMRTTLREIDTSETYSYIEKYHKFTELYKNNPNQPDILRQLLSCVAECLEYSQSDLSAEQISTLVSDSEKYAKLLHKNVERPDLAVYPYRRMADIYMAVKMYDKAEAEIARMADSACPRSLMQGKLQFKQEHYVQCREPFQKAILYCGECMLYAMNRLAGSYMLTGNRKKAVRIYKYEYDMFASICDCDAHLQFFVAEYTHAAIRLAQDAVLRGACEEAFVYLDTCMEIGRRYRACDVKNMEKSQDDIFYDPTRFQKKGYVTARLAWKCFDRIREDERFQGYCKEAESMKW